MSTQILTSTVLLPLGLESTQKEPVTLRPQGAPSNITVPPGKMAIKIPDMFKSFMSATPRINPFYDEVKVEGEQWIAE